MDAVYAWDQPDFHFYVPAGDHPPSAKALRFQTSLRGAKVPEEPKDAGSGVGGSMPAPAEQLREPVIVFAERLLTSFVMQQVFQFAAEVVGGQIGLDQLFYDQFIHDEVDEGDIFHFDKAAGDL